MLSIDNAVELMIKTYLGLPQRVNGLALSRREYDEISESFPRLLDALHKYARDRLEGIDLGQLEWYHRLRNQLYHEGNGLTVEKDKVVVYARLAKVLFATLFGYELEVRDTASGVITPNAPLPLPPMSPPRDPALFRGLRDSGDRKAWWYLSGQNSDYFIVSVNARGSCSVRIFDASSGRAIEKKYGPGDYQVHFGELLKSARPLQVPRQPNLEKECRGVLPGDVLAALKSQLPSGASPR
jgi:hypothetical protein